MLGVEFVTEAGELLLGGAEGAGLRLVPSDGKPVFAVLAGDRENTTDGVGVVVQVDRLCGVLAGVRGCCAHLFVCFKVQKFSDSLLISEYKDTTFFVIPKII